MENGSFCLDTLGTNHGEARSRYKDLLFAQSCCCTKHRDFCKICDSINIRWCGHYLWFFWQMKYPTLRKGKKFCWNLIKDDKKFFTLFRDSVTENRPSLQLLDGLEKIVCCLAAANDMNHALDLISQWAYTWKMSFNPDPQKQAVELKFSRKKSEIDHPVILFNNIPVKKVDEHKDLVLSWTRS